MGVIRTAFMGGHLEQGGIVKGVLECFITEIKAFDRGRELVS